jgi:hypothetical protein
MDIINNINLLCLALSPWAVAARAIHQIPIAMKQKTRDLTYNKYTKDVLLADSRYTNDIWHSFQFVEWRFNDKWIGADKVEERINIWSMKHFGIPANCIRWNGTPKSYIEMITRKKPSEVIRNHTHLVVICEDTNNVFGLLDHYYCDGIVLMNYFRQMFIEEKITFPNFPKYIYYPFISDAMAIQMMSKQAIEIFKYPSQINYIDDKTRVLSKRIYKNEDWEWNRWTIYALGTLPVFESMPNVDYLHVALTVGFDTDQTFGNNRIGVIIMRIMRPTQSTYKERIIDLMEQYKTQTIANYTDAHTFYDIMRGYDTSYLRRFYTNKIVDVIFTALYFKEDITQLDGGLGGFVGSMSDTEYLYINAISTKNTTNLTYVSNLKQMNYDTLTNDGMTIEYEFANNDPGQY